MFTRTVRISLPLYVILFITLAIAVTAVLAFVAILVIKVSQKSSRSSQVDAEKGNACESLGETLKQRRIDCNMTQEYVAEAMNVSRQAVSKWETGTSEPSTANLLALAKLYGVSAEELLKIDNKEIPIDNKETPLVLKPVQKGKRTKRKSTKPRDFFRFLWNFLVMSTSIAFSIFFITQIDGYNPHFLVGYFSPNVMAYSFYVSLVTSGVLIGVLTFNIINIVKCNFNLQDRKAIIMKRLHSATVGLCIVAILWATVFPNSEAIGGKLFHAMLLIASLREVVYQVMLFVDNSKKESKSKGNRVCFVCSSIGVLVLVIFSIYSISLAVNSAYTFEVKYAYGSGTYFAIGNRGWLIFSAIALSIITIWFIVSLLKEIKKSKEKEQIE